MPKRPSNRSNQAGQPKLFHTGSGLPVVHERSAAIPLVDFAIFIRHGAQEDPVGAEGAARLRARLLRCGSRGSDLAEVDEAIALLGARISFAVGRNVMRVTATVLSRNLAPLITLLARLLREPAFRNDDFRREKRQVLADILDAQDDDSALANRHLNALLYGTHPYATPVGGTAQSNKRVKLAHIKTAHQTAMVRKNLLFAAAGDVDEETLAHLLDEAFGDLPARVQGASKARIPAPKVPKGVRVRIVNKVGRTQTHLGIATLGTKLKDPLLVPLVVGDCVFGGLFTSRLVEEVRAKRGWSYAAQSHLRVTHQRGPWSLWTHPSVDHALDAVALQVEMMRAFVAKGPTAAEVKQAKRYLIGSRCLDEDTASRRVELCLDAVHAGLGVEHPAGFGKRIRAVKRKDIAEAYGKRIDMRALSIVAVGDASLLRPQFESLDGVTSVEVVPVGLP